MSPWALTLFRVELRHPIAELALCGSESVGHERLCALLLKPFWEVRKPGAPLSFGQDYLPYQNDYGLSKSDKLLFKISVPTERWRGLHVGCLLWGRDCCESPLTWRDCMQAAGELQNFLRCLGASGVMAGYSIVGEIKSKCYLDEK